jgi:hypothetical protein
MCHPETCCHQDNYKIFVDGDLVGWASTEKEAKDYGLKIIKLEEEMSSLREQVERLEKWLEHKS